MGGDGRCLWSRWFQLRFSEEAFAGCSGVPFTSSKWGLNCRSSKRAVAHETFEFFFYFKERVWLGPRLYTVGSHRARAFVQFNVGLLECSLLVLSAGAVRFDRRASAELHISIHSKKTPLFFSSSRRERGEKRGGSNEVTDFLWL